MKSKQLFLLRKKGHALVMATSMLLFCACLDGYKDDTTFTSDVKGVELESPKADDVRITYSADGSKQTISWSVVYGAGGYSFSLYIVDDPENPIAVGEENQVIDGCSATRDLQEDTKYKLCLKTLGNEKYNNKEASAATELAYSTLLPTYAVIPDGTDIYEYFQENPIPESKDELAYDLIAGGTYSLSGLVDFGTHKITFRGDKVHRPTIAYAAKGGLATTAGLKIKFIDFDCTASPINSILSFSATPDEALLKNTFYIINDPVVIQSCNFKSLDGQLIYDNKKKYCPVVVLIKDCVVDMNTTARVINMNGGNGYINDLTIQNSTFSNVVGKANAYFIQYNGTGRPDRAGFLTGSINLYNNTLYNIAYGKNICNYDAMRGRKEVSLNLSKNIFVDSGKEGQVVRMLLGGANGMVMDFRSNSYWYNGNFPTGETGWDKSSTHLEVDPMFKDPNGGDFTVQSPDHIAVGCGDPRWLPKED